MSTLEMGSAWLRHTEEERGKINKAFEPEEKLEKQDWKGFQSHRLRNEWQTTYLFDDRKYAKPKKTKYVLSCCKSNSIQI